MKIDVIFEQSNLKKKVSWPTTKLKQLFTLLQKETLDWPENEATLAKLGVKRIQSLSLLFCEDETMRAYQRDFRKLDRTTDILSFPSAELELLDSEKDGHLGELIVSWPAIERGAKRGRRTVKRELLNVLIHGYLHLLGFDHVQGGAKAKKMRKSQAFLFRRLLKVIK